MSKAGILVAAVAWLCGAADAVEIVLRDEAYVKGPTLSLGEVAVIKGENAELLAAVELGAAAAPGGARRLDTALIQSKIQQAGLGGGELVFSGARRVTASTLYLDITSEMLEQDLRHFVAENMPWDAADTMITTRAFGTDFVIPDGVLEIRWQPSPEYAYLGAGSFRGEVLVDGKLVRSLQGRAEVQAFGEIVVAARDLARNDVISRHAVTLSKRDLATVGAGAIFDIDEVEGLVAKSPIMAGQPIAADKVKAAMVVRRRQLVTVETHLGPLSIRVRGKALHDAAAGETVRVENLSSGEELIGIVRSDGTVEIF